jgi:hypothetical protein
MAVRPTADSSTAVTVKTEDPDDSVLKRAALARNVADLSIVE